MMKQNDGKRLVPLFSHKGVPKMHELFFKFADIHKIIKHLGKNTVRYQFSGCSISCKMTCPQVLTILISGGSSQFRRLHEYT